MILKSFTIRQNRWRPFRKNTLIKTRPWRKKCKHSKKINSRLRKRKIKFKLNSITRLKSSSTSCSMEVQLTVMMILGEATTKPWIAARPQRIRSKIYCRCPEEIWMRFWRKWKVFYKLAQSKINWEMKLLIKARKWTSWELNMSNRCITRR